MEKLQMCRICLVANVRMFVVVNKNLHRVYEKLTDVPFLTEDKRPMLACFLCCAKLKQCYRLLRQCLKAEALFAQMTNEDYEPNPLINEDPEFFSGFIKSPTENISIDDECQTESIAIKEELPAVCEGLDDIIEPKEEHQSVELDLENFDNSCLDVADIPLQQSESDSESDLEDDVPLIVFKTEVEKQAVSKNKQRARESTRTTVAKKPKLNTRRVKLEDAITAEQTKKENSDSNFIRIIQKPKPGTYFQELYKCDQRDFNPVKKKIHHTRTKIGKKPYKCDVCHRSFSLKGHLTKHIRIHTGEKPFKCDICERSFCNTYRLKRHFLIHTGEKPYNCDVCQRSFSDKCALTKHIRVHTGEKPYKCDICQCSFRQHGHLTSHIRKHTGENPYKCDFCQRSFIQNSALTTHIRKHTGEKPFKCDICQCSFRQSGHLKNHMRKHTGENPYKCDSCQRSFIQKSALAIHIRKHTGEKPFKCDICQCSFRQRGHLTSHIRKHTGENPYKCDSCQRSFIQKSALTTHIRKHTGEKPFKCDICQCSFRQRGHLTSHILKHTGETPSKCGKHT